MTTPIAVLSADELDFEAPTDACLDALGANAAAAGDGCAVIVATALGDGDVECRAIESSTLAADAWAERGEHQPTPSIVLVPVGGWLRTVAIAPPPEHAGPSRPPLLRPPRA